MAGTRPRRPTIADVARHAGVSTAAVSKVLRDAPGTSVAMHTKVRASIAALGYRPHAAARGLRGRTYTLGLILPDLRNAFFADLAEGIQQVLDDSAFQLVFGSEFRSPEAQRRLAEALVDRSVDGLVLVAPIIPRDLVRALAGTLPVTVIGHHDEAEEYDTVVDDDRAGAALVVDHLASLGHERIAHITSYVSDSLGWSASSAQVRAEGYREAMTVRGLAAQVRLAYSYFTEEGGYAAARELLDVPPAQRPTAVFAGTDMTALGVLRAAAESGLRVPEDLSLVGYDNSAVAGYAPIHLASVDQEGHAMGTAAARLLLERLNGRTAQAGYEARPRLVVRTSTAAPRTH